MPNINNTGSYPLGVAALADRVPYIADPAGTPALRQATVSDLTGGHELRAWDGTSLTGTSPRTGTWAAATEIAQSDTANTAHDLLLADGSTYSPMSASIEMELQWSGGSGTYTGISTLNNGSFLTAGACIAVGTNLVSIISAGAAVLATTAVTAAADTWHTLRVMKAGLLWAVYLDGAFVRDWAWGTGNVGGNGVSLYSQGCASKFRNVRLWLP